MVAGGRVELPHQAYETQAVKPLRPALDKVYRVSYPIKKDKLKLLITRFLCD